MAKQAAAAQTASGRPTAQGASVSTGEVFDLYGMPMTVDAARSMTAASVISAMSKALSNLRRVADPAAIASAGSALDSLEVIWLLAKFDKPFGRQLIDVTKVDRHRWSNLADVAGLVHESIGSAS
ncbi:hypothetical protein [Agromyces bauzanensis]|uniref:Uncharacterized protein n=1 Tax=Agromyces bauzanensis TaxID=1308924 RepID=A0A917PPY9_9MICO|nr:hypothetical protein [Agromyces bauzanensis]GGJ87453.1 hypothetical protein GCM10011372_27450 [Agromyces bauzanensis]